VNISLNPSDADALSSSLSFRASREVSYRPSQELLSLIAFGDCLSLYSRRDQKSLSLDLLSPSLAE